MGLDVSILSDFCVSESGFFFCRRVSEFLICRNFFPFGLQESNFSEFMGTTYQTKPVD